jgi:peptidoglycan/xylan/chitin deacetylase (PgdA/CDA1 family)
MRAFTRRRAASILTSPPLGFLTRRRRWSGVLVLTFHRVGDRESAPWDRSLWSVDADQFDAHVAALARTCDIVPLQELGELARARRRGRMVLITFDDGYRDNYEIAYPILRAHAATAAFFVPSGVLDRPSIPWWDEIAWMVRNSSQPTITGVGDRHEELRSDRDHADATIRTLVERYKSLAADQTASYLDAIATATATGRYAGEEAEQHWMTWDMVRHLRDEGMAIGGHTDSHAILARLSEADQRREIETCAARMSEELEADMRWFAYPVGSRDTFTATTQRLLRECGVELAFSFYGGFASFHDWTPLDIPRMGVFPAMTASMLEAATVVPRLYALA